MHFGKFDFQIPILHFPLIICTITLMALVVNIFGVCCRNMWMILDHLLLKTLTQGKSQLYIAVFDLKLLFDYSGL